ncbi:hypothetical protein [Rathayibacter festucae]|uniref:hypothetical protein n=1 Tax=Rathayibacter festucae TaxID=110937 RepID=UPI002A6A926A|nr:hypothetical protein [Rathayibacter festucae]MDY0914975.1 hypothetical protein [Rathayibacter festucae]
MKKHPLTTAFAVASIGVALAVVAAVPAHAISRPACGERADFLKFHNGSHCYANGGTATNRLRSQQTISSGNNSGYFTASGLGDVSFEPAWGTTYATPQTVSIEHID